MGNQEMKLRARILTGGGVSLMASLVPLLVTPPAFSADLLQVYERALQNDPQIREAEANRLASRESKPQALASLLPQIDGSGSYTKTHSEQNYIDLYDNPDPDAPEDAPEVPFPVRTVSATRDASWELSLRQTIFRWDQWMTLKRADAEVAQAEADFQAAQQDLIQRTAQRYFDVLAAQDTVDSAQATLEAYSRQLEQADKRFEVGLIAITDVQETRAAHDEAAASVIEAKRSLATAQELLRELTGEPFETLAAPIDDLPLKSPDPQNVEQWVTTALEQNLSVVSARLATDIAKQDVRVERAGHLPTLDLVASHQGTDSSGHEDSGIRGGAITRTPGEADSEDNTIGLQISIPIYSGGGTSSRVRQRVYLHRAARERLEREIRETERSTRDAYLGVLSEISRVQALKQAVASGQTALQATEAGFEVGTRTTVDVLDSRRRLFDAQTNYSSSRYDYLLNILQLQLASGTLNRADLEEINSWLKK